MQEISEGQIPRVRNLLASLPRESVISELSSSAKTNTGNVLSLGLLKRGKFLSHPSGPETQANEGFLLITTYS